VSEKKTWKREKQESKKCTTTPKEKEWGDIRRSRVELIGKQRAAGIRRDRNSERLEEIQKEHSSLAPSKESCKTQAHTAEARDSMGVASCSLSGTTPLEASSPVSFTSALSFCLSVTHCLSVLLLF